MSVLSSDTASLIGDTSLYFPLSSKNDLRGFKTTLSFVLRVSLMVL